MDRIEDLEAFLAIVDMGSQSGAARHLHRSLQSIGRSLTLLEQCIGVPLIKRTTRQSHPTEAGRAFYSRVKPAVADIAQARLEVAGMGSELSGRLRVGAPALFARAFLVPAVCDFLARFPRVEVDVRVSDRQVDLLERDLDMAVRIRRLPDSTLKVRRLGEMRLAAFAAPDYLEKRGRPRHPSELSRHHCVVRCIDDADDGWRFRIDGRRQVVRVRGRFRCDDTSAVHVAVARGAGIGFGPLWQIGELLESGAVEVVLPEFSDILPIHAVFPPTRTQPVKVRLLADLLALHVRRANL